MFYLKKKDKLVFPLVLKRNMVVLYSEASQGWVNIISEDWLHLNVYKEKVMIPFIEFQIKICCTEMASTQG